MEHGELIKHLRESRRLSQGKLAESCGSTRSTLASFEHSDGKRISYALLNKYCQAMNVTLEEYEYLRDEEVLSDKRLVAKLASRSFKATYDEAIAKLFIDKFDETHDFYYYSLYAQYFLIKNYHAKQLQQLIVSAKDEREALRICSRVQQYLDRIYPWGRFEIALFTNCMFIFSDEQIRSEYDDVVVHMRMYKDSSNYSRDLLKFLINGTQLSFERNNMNNMRRFLGELRQEAQFYSDTKARMIIKIFSVLQEHRVGKDVSGELERLLDMLEYLGETHWLEYTKRWIENPNNVSE